MTLKCNIQGTGASSEHSEAVCGELAPYVTAAGSTQATATLLRRITRHIVTAGSGGVIIPPGIGAGDLLQYGDEIEVTNASGVSINVYPPLGSLFLGSATNAAIILVNGYSVSLMVDSSTRMIPRFYSIASGSGTVASVGMTVPGSIMSVANSPITTSGSLDVSLTTQTAHCVWAGPTSGVPATPTFRTLVSGDIPSLSYAPQTSGSSVLSGNGSGGFSNVTIGTGLSFAGGTLAATGGGGSVSSVALTAPAEITVTGSPVTTTGTLALAWANETANRIFAGPTSGGAATPGFRALVAADIPANVKLATIFYEINGGGIAIQAGLKGYMQINFDCTIAANTVMADQSGSIVINIWKCTYAQFDAGSTHPVAADKITASAPPTITTAVKSTDSTLTGWTTTITAGDILAFNVDSATTISRAELQLKVSKT